MTPTLFWPGFDSGWGLRRLSRSRPKPWNGVTTWADGRSIISTCWRWYLNDSKTFLEPLGLRTSRTTIGDEDLSSPCGSILSWHSYLSIRSVHSHDFCNCTRRNRLNAPYSSYQGFELKEVFIPQDFHLQISAHTRIYIYLFKTYDVNLKLVIFFFVVGGRNAVLSSLTRCQRLERLKQYNACS